MSLDDRCHSGNPPPLLKGGLDLQQIESLGEGGVPKILLERRDNPEKGGGVDVEIGGLPRFYYFNVQLHLLCLAGKSKVSFTTFWFFSLLS